MQSNEAEHDHSQGRSSPPPPFNFVPAKALASVWGTPAYVHVTVRLVYEVYTSIST